MKPRETLPFNPTCRRQSPEGAEDRWPCLSCPAVRYPHKNGLGISKIPKDLHPLNFQDSFKSCMHRNSSIWITHPKIWPRLIRLGRVEGNVSDLHSEHVQPLTPLCHLLRGLWFCSERWQSEYLCFEGRVRSRNWVRPGHAAIWNVLYQSSHEKSLGLLSNTVKKEKNQPIYLSGNFLLV